MSHWRRAFLVVLLAACVDGPGGPGRFGEVRVEPGYQPGYEPAAIGVALDEAAVSVARVGGEPVVDTSVPYSGGELAWIVELEAEEESLIVAVELKGGGVSFYRGDSVVVVPAGTVSGQSAQLAVNYVGPALVGSITVSPATSTVLAGATVPFTATAFDLDGNPIAGQAFDWASSDTAVATVDPATGLATARSSGRATITASAGGKSGTATLDVSQPNPVVSVTVTPAAATLSAVGATQPFTAVALDASGAPVSGIGFSWTSSTPGVATIDPVSGLAVATGHGSTVITATTAGVSGTATLDVDLAPTVVTVSVTPSSATITALGGTQQFTAVVRDGNGAVLPGVPVAWSSSDPAVVTVDPTSGLATAVGNGTATVTAAAGSVSGSATAVVHQLAITVTVRPDSVTLTGLSKVAEFVAEARDANGQLMSGVVFTWSSSDPAVAMVELTRGRTVPQGFGKAIISATTGGVTGSAVLVVLQPE